MSTNPVQALVVANLRPVYVPFFSVVVGMLARPVAGYVPFVVMGGSCDAVPVIARALHEEINKRHEHPVVQLVFHKATDEGTPADIVHAQRGMACIAVTSNLDSFIGITTQPNDPTVHVFSFNGERGRWTDSELTAGIAEFVDECCD
jgi:hypothetical protein